MSLSAEGRNSTALARRLGSKGHSGSLLIMLLSRVSGIRPFASDTGDLVLSNGLRRSRRRRP